MAWRNFRFAAALLALLIVGFAASNVPMAAQDNESAEELFDKGIKQFKNGNYGYDNSAEGQPPGAMFYFERVKSRLSAEGDKSKLAGKVNIMLREATTALMLRMSQIEHTNAKVQGDLRAFARYMLGQAELVTHEFVFDKDAIRRALARAMDPGNPRDNEEWGRVVITKYGEYAVPEIHRLYLHSGNSQLMGRAMQLLEDIGRNSVNPLIEVLDSANLYDRLHAASVLGRIADRRALPALVERLQSQNEKQEVKEACKKAVELIWGGPVNTDKDLPPAKAMYLAQAREYYDQKPELLFGRVNAFVIWRWVPNDPDDLAKGGFLDFDAKIPLWAYMDVMAEEACIDALTLDSEYSEAWDLLVDINLRQYLEATARLGYASDQEREIFTELFKRTHRGAVLAAPAGQLAIFRAIQRALNDRLPEVAVAAMDKLIEVGDARYIPQPADYDTTTGEVKKEGAPLIRALTYEDKRVRYAAARALFTLNNNRIRYRDANNQEQKFTPFFAMETARDVLVQGLGEYGQRTILVITPNLDLRNDMRKKLDDLGYYPYFAESPAEGLQRILSFPADDLILLDAKVASTPIRVMTSRKDEFRGQDIERVQTLLAILKDDFRTAEIPVVLFYDTDTDKEDDVRDRFQSEFTANKIEKDILKVRANSMNPAEADLGIFTAVWQKRQFDSKDRANRVAIRCAEAIRSWDPDQAPNAEFFRPVIHALVARVNDRRKNTDVKVAMLQTLEQFCQAKDENMYKVDFWNQDVIPHVLPVLTRPAEIDEPIVKYWACKVLTAIYLNRKQGALWQANVDPRTDKSRDPNQNPFWALFNLLDYNPDVLPIDESKSDKEKEDWKRKWERDVRAVREAAGEVLGCAPMTNAQRLYVYQHKRINRKEAVNYGPGK